MNRIYLTKEPIVVRIDPTIRKSNSNFGNYQVTYYIKWSKEDKNEIGTYEYFWKKQQAQK